MRVPALKETPKKLPTAAAAAVSSSVNAARCYGRPHMTSSGEDTLIGRGSGRRYKGSQRSLFATLRQRTKEILPQLRVPQQAQERHMQRETRCTCALATRGRKSPLSTTHTERGPSSRNPLALPARVRYPRNSGTPPPPPYQQGLPSPGVPGHSLTPVASGDGKDDSSPFPKRKHSAEQK